ncbi:ABC transporter permease, partial [Rhizobium ruizarguesonis]
LALGMVIALLPFAIVIIASTLYLETVNRVPLPLVPGSHFWEKAQTAWVRADLGNKLFPSIIFAAPVGAGKIMLSSMAAFSIAYFR